MIAVLTSNKELGIYSVALRLSEIWYIIPTLIVSSIVPKLISLNLLSHNLFLERLKIILYYFTLTAYIIAIIMTFLSPFLINFIYGEDYIKAGPILSIHIWSAIFVFIGVATSPWYTIQGLLKYSMYQTLIGAVINIILNFFLIPKFGGLGASISTVIAYAFGAFILNACFKKTRVIFNLQLKSLCLIK
jgi:PST family polysaccharide transporter